MDKNEPTQKEVDPEPLNENIVLKDPAPFFNKTTIIIVIVGLFLTIFFSVLFVRYASFDYPKIDILDTLGVKDEDLRPSSQNFVTRKLAKIPYGYGVYPLLFSPDGKTLPT
jgi:hypothetical protein